MSNPIRARLIATTLIAAILAFYGSYTGQWWITTLAIMLVPLSFLRRK